TYPPLFRPPYRHPTCREPRPGPRRAARSVPRRLRAGHCQPRGPRRRRPRPAGPRARSRRRGGCRPMKKATTWALPAALTTIAIVWAVAAIGGILTATAHPAFAYSVAVLYDAVWLYALAQEAAHRRQGSDARLPKVIGWVFLPLTVGVLAAHGLLAGDVLAAVVAALIPLLAKLTLVMAIDRDRTRLSPRAQAAIDRTRAATRDRIAVSRAVAQARADETKAAAEILRSAREAEAEAVTVTHD